MLHSTACKCEGCKELGMGYPAFCDGADEQWDTVGPNPQFTPGNYDPSTFGKVASKYHRRGYGQAFIPGTVAPPMPISAFAPVAPSGPIFSLPGLPQNADQAIALLSAQGQEPSQTTGIAPTLTIAQAKAVAANAGFDMNADGSLAPGAPATLPTSYILGAIALLWFLK